MESTRYSAVGSGREREKAGVDLVLGPSQIAAAPSVCTQSFLFFYSDTEAEAVSTGLILFNEILPVPRFS